MTLTGKTAIVTGASSGIGRATARHLAGKDCNVVLAARRTDRLDGLAAEIGDRALAVPTDVTEPGDCEALITRTIDRFGDVDILVNNAGLGLYDPIHEADPDDWRRMFEVNVLGALNLTAAATRRMLSQGAGDIVFISSVAGRRVPRPDGTVYAATKHAVTAIAEGLRMDLCGKGVRVVTIEPGLVRTEFPEGSFSSAEDYYASKEYTPLDAEDIARAVAYAVDQPPNVSVNEVLIRPSSQLK